MDLPQHDHDLDPPQHDHDAPPDTTDAGLMRYPTPDAEQPSHDEPDRDTLHDDSSGDVPLDETGVMRAEAEAAETPQEASEPTEVAQTASKATETAQPASEPIEAGETPQAASEPVEDGETPQAASEVTTNEAAPRLPAPSLRWRPRMSLAPHQLILGLILAVGAALRYYGLGWDHWSGLHPDERHVVSLVQAINLPASLAQFLTPSGPAGIVSPFEPHDFAYGSLPVYLYWIIGHIAAWLGSWAPGLSSWQGALGDGVFATGRAVSAAAGVLTILIVYLIGTRAYNRAIGLLGAAFFSLCVLDVQLSHFLTVDPLTTLFATLAIYGCVRIAQEGRPRDYVLAGAAIGAALACKVSVLALFAPLVVAPILASLWTLRAGSARTGSAGFQPANGAGKMPAVPGRNWARFGWTLAALAAGVVVFFVTQPYALIDWPKYIADVQAQARLASGTDHTFYTDKFFGTPPYWYHIEHIVPWDLGWPLGLAAMAGVVAAAWRTITRRRNAGEIVILVWTLAYFLSTGEQFMKYVRYMLPIMPELCVLAAAVLLPALVTVGRRVRVPIPRWQWALAGGVLALTLLYAVAYDNIYSTLNTRLQASDWFTSHVRPGTPYVTEGQYDEPIPWSYPGHPALGYNGVSIATVSGGDTLAAWSEPRPQGDGTTWPSISAALSSAQYATISSDRIIGTVPHLPQAFPYSGHYYKLLFDFGRDGVDPLGFRLAKSFDNHPHLFGISLDDYVADQNFSEYDHPPVWIFQRVKPESAAQTLALVTDNGRIHDAAAVATPDKPLLLSQQQKKLNATGPSYAQEFAAGSLAMRFPAPVWLIALELLGLLALPLTLRLFRRLPDRGFILAKTFGLLLTGYLAWLVSSFNASHGLLALRFERPLLIAAALAVGVASLLWGLPLREVVGFVRERRVQIVAVEAVFLAGFVANVVVRMIYPDLWHGWNGGEKPMNFSYLNGVVRSQSMPPADPWFAGGYINYYYYGYVLVTALIKLTGIAPSIAYNLAVPTLFALTLASAYTLGYALTRRVGVGLLAAGLAVLAGNLYAGVQVVATLIAVSPLQSTFPLLGGVIGVVGGAWQLVTQQLLAGHQVVPALAFRGGSTGWGWDATRVLDGGLTINEFPFFTFLYGDLHAHMMDLPNTMACLALGLNAAFGAHPWRSGRREGVGRALLPGAGAVMLLLAALAVGATGPTNSWDLPAALLVVALGVGVHTYVRRAGPWTALLWAAGAAVALAVLALGLYYPFYSHLKSFYSSVGVQLAHTDFGNFLMMWGLFLFILASYLARELWTGATGAWLRRHERAGEFVLYYWPRRERVRRLYRAIAPRYRAVGRIPIAPVYSLIALAAGVLLALAALVLAAPVLALLLVLLGAAVAALLEPGKTALTDEKRHARGATLLLAVLALGMTATCEFAYLADFNAGGDYYRMNTVFKLYEQGWLFFAVASAAALASLVRLPRLALPALAPVRPATALGIVATPPRPAPSRADSGTSERGPRRDASAGFWRRAWLGALGLLLLGVVVYPVVETPLRLADRPLSGFWTAAGNPPLGPTLDGTAFVQKAFPGEYRALTWLNNHVTGDPTVLTSSQGNYDDFAFRVEWMTGLPTVVQWPGEQSQQRYSGQTDTKHWPYVPYPNEVQTRQDDVTTIYSTTDTALALNLLHRYHVGYVYVGLAERGENRPDPTTGCFAYGMANMPAQPECVGYPPAGLAKFDAMAAAGTLKTVYNRDGVKIYQVMK